METVEFESYGESVALLLDRLGAGKVLAEQSRVLVKPNLINSSPPPITTAVACCEAIVEYAREHSGAEIVVGDGCGDPGLTTDEVFDQLGYRDMARRQGVELVDLNEAELVRLENPDCHVFPEMYLPEIAMSSYLVSVPVLKAHSLADLTGTRKNMIGLAPPSHYAGRHGSWKKAVFHGDLQQSILDLNRYRTPDLTVLDATIGMQDYHLGGRHCDPPVNKLLAGFDPREVDRAAAELLGLDWQVIGHLK
ncbi:MAG: DUF362 domain-containing protein [Lentisphaerae bacterium]|nr:DUF362 domain-containing protein [Lentisphaerota bacterium]